MKPQDISKRLKLGTDFVKKTIRATKRELDRQANGNVQNERKKRKSATSLQDNRELLQLIQSYLEVKGVYNLKLKELR